MSTTQQPEALRLADAVRTHDDHPRVHFYNRVAAELRRLHAENKDLRTRHYCNTAEIESLQHRVQELGEMARENRSKRIVELEGRIAEMEEQMAAIGAGGVEPLRKRSAQAAQAAVPQIDWESAAEKIAIEVADNCGTVPNLTHPHIYLGLKKLFASHLTQQRMDAQELLAALGDLSFACFGGIGTKAPDAATYNRTFAVFQKHRDAAQAKQGEAQQ